MSTSHIQDLGAAIAHFIGAGDDPRSRFTEVHNAIDSPRNLVGLLRNVEAERLLSGANSPRVTAQMRDLVTASGNEGTSARDDLFYAIADQLVALGVRLAPESQPQVVDTAAEHAA